MALEVNLQAANTGFTVSNISLAVGAALALLGTLGVLFFGGIKERFADERIAANETETARATEAAALADQRAAEANLAAERERVARLRLEERLAPRTLSQAQFLRLRQRLAVFAPQGFEFVSFQDDPEVVGLVHSLVALLTISGWTGYPATAFLMAQHELGVNIWYRSDKEAEFGAAARGLAQALLDEGLQVSAVPSPNLGEEWNDRIQVRVGKKP